MANRNSFLVLHLSLIEGVTPQAVHAVSERAPLDETLYGWLPSDFVTRCGISQKHASKLVQGLRDKTIVDKELALLEKHAISYVTLFDEHYPQHLKEIHLPPPVLYYRGAPLHSYNNMIAVVGARKADRYGQRIVDSFVPSLVAHEWAIVSGGARGADSMAHYATVNAGGKTVVVLGSGLLRPYPAVNKPLFESVIASGGTVCSPFALEMEPLPYNFPARNRIIAGLSRGCIVVQAAAKSGARITAEFALDQGRDVFAVPGIFDDPLSAGCHKLIADGATVITSLDDILTFYNDIPCQKSQKQQHAIQTTISESKKTYAPSSRLDALDGDKKLIADVCVTPCSLEAIVTKTALSCNVVQTLLFELQIDGYVQQDFTGQWMTIG